MKRAIIVHGWGSNPNDWWFKKEKKILGKKGYRVAIPLMPNTLLPKRTIWVRVLRLLVPGEKTVLIGHSLGCPTILRYLEKAKKPVDKVFLVAPFARDLGLNFVPIQDFVSKPFNWGKIRENANEFYVITQKDDEWTPVEYGVEVAEILGARLTITEGNDHLQESLDLNLINDNL